VQRDPAKQLVEAAGVNRLCACRKRMQEIRIGFEKFEDFFDLDLASLDGRKEGERPVSA